MQLNLSVTATLGQKNGRCRGVAVAEMSKQESMT